MKFSYLSRGTLLVLFFLLALTWVLQKSTIFLFFLFFSLLLLFFFRKSSLRLDDDSLVPSSFIVSPTNGVVYSVRKNIDHNVFGKGLSELRVSLTWFNEFGLGFPLEGEVRGLKSREGKSFFRLFRKGLENDEKFHVHARLLEIKGRHGQEIGLEFIKCELGFDADLWVKPGDRGKRSARFGYFPFGGTVLIYLPPHFDVLISQGDKCIQGSTPIAVQLGRNH